MPTVLMNKQTPLQHQNVFQNQTKQTKNGEAHGDVLQDKSGDSSGRTASDQPASDSSPSDRVALATKPPRSQSGSVSSRAKVPMTLHIDPILKAEIQRQACLNGNSASSEGGAMLEAKAREQLHKQQAATLEVTLQRLYAKANRSMAKKLAFFLTVILFDVGQIKVHTTNLLGMQKGMTGDMLKDILTDADRQTKRRLSRKYPELTDLIKAVEEWLVAAEEDEEGRGETNGHSRRGGGRV